MRMETRSNPATKVNKKMKNKRILFKIFSLTLLAGFLAIYLDPFGMSSTLAMRSRSETEIDRNREGSDRTLEETTSEEKENREQQNSQIEYQLPREVEYQRQRTRSGGNRGKKCDRPLNNEGIEIIAPEDHVALTINSQPTFYVVLKEVPQAEIRYSINSTDRLLFVETTPVDRRGIIPITLPQSVKLDTPGEYFLTLGLVCNQEIPVNDPHVRVKFRKIYSSSSLEAELKSADSTVQSAKILARSSLWYDALDLAYKSKDDSIFRSLASQAGFEDINY